MSDYRDSVTLEQYEECLGDKSFFFAHNPEGIFTYVSPSITKVLGYAPEDFLAHYTQFLTDNPKNHLVQSNIDIALAGGKVPAYTVESYHCDGGIRWLQVQEFGVCNDQNKVVAVHGLATDITAYKQTLQQLELQTQRFQRAENMAKVGSWELNLGTQDLYWSKEVFRIFELDPTQTKPSYELLLERTHPADRDKLNNAYYHSLETRKPYQVEHRLSMPDGRVKHVLEEGVSDFDTDGRALMSSGTVQDITAYHMAKQQLVEKQALLKEAETIAQIGSWEYEIASEKIILSDGCYAILGLSSGMDVVYEDFIALVHEDDRKAVEASFERNLAFDEEQISVYRIVRSSGETRYIEQRGITRFDANHSATHIVGTLQDITNQYMAQQALEKQKTLLRSVINATTDLIFIKDAMGVYQGCNPAFERFTDKTEAEIIGKTDYDLFDWEVADFFRQQDYAMFDSGKARQNEEWVTYPDGKEVLVDTLKTPFYGEDGNVYGLVGVSRDITARKKAEEKLYYLAHHDDLTGLANRHLFTSLLDQAVAHSERHREKLAILFIDLDHFKQINDSLGHQIGDQVLEQVGKQLQTTGRKSDTIARLGGDEFAFLMRDLKHPEDAQVVAQKVLKALEKPFLVESHKLYIGASIGISIYPDNGETSDILLRNADAAMYRAKDNDRNTYAFYTDELTQIAFQHIQLESELRRALQENEFEVYYQPKYECEGKRIVGSEALIRWQHPTRGLLLPGQFIAEAEKSDLIIELGEWVLREACIQNAKWHRMGLKSGRVAVNVSGRQITKHDLSATVQRVLQETDCKPKWLELEIIERFVMNSPEQTLQVLNEIHRSGVAFAIDDFGIEYSSLSYLKQMPLNTLKIDLSFIRDIPEDKDDMAIVEAMLALAKSFNLIAVAEGVEREEQLDFLRDSGADRFQGFLLSRPMPASEFEALLKTHPTL
jgi:PAS domain S-box/diguanylate cyclase (GGDEF) domain